MTARTIAWFVLVVAGFGNLCLFVSICRSVLWRRRVCLMRRAVEEFREEERRHVIYLARDGRLLRARFEPPGEGARA